MKMKLISFFAFLMVVLLCVTLVSHEESASGFSISGTINLPQAEDSLVTVQLYKVIDGAMVENVIANVDADVNGNYIFLEKDGTISQFEPGTYAIQVRLGDTRIGSIQIFSISDKDVQINILINEESDADCNCL